MEFLMFLSFMAMGVECGYIRYGMSETLFCYQVKTRAPVLAIEKELVFPALKSDQESGMVILHRCSDDGLVCNNVAVKR
jgi:hypothetical protein